MRSLITLLVLIIRYRVRDARGNATATRTWRGYFTAGSATSTCDLPANVHTISDTP